MFCFIAPSLAPGA